MKIDRTALGGIAITVGWRDLWRLLMDGYLRANGCRITLGDN